jgi:hypothetical protein
MTLPAAPAPPVTRRMVLRRDLRGPAQAAVALLAAIIALNVAGIAWGAAGDWPGRFDELWMLLCAVTGVVFLVWFAAARENAASYRPGRSGAYPDWTVAGWIVPVASLWVPYRITADIWRASARPAIGTADTPGGGRARVMLLRWWWALWLGMWLAFWSFMTAYLAAGFRGWGVTAAQQLLDLAFQLLSIGAAACAIAVVATITRHQARRAAEPVFQPETVPRVFPAALVAGIAVTAAICSPFLAMTLFIAARDTTSLILARADLAPTQAEIVGSWHAGDGGRLVFTRDGRFSATGMSVNLAADGTPTAKRWSGHGTWQTGGTCDRSAPGICLTIGGTEEDGWTDGPRSSPVLLIPAVPAGQDYDAAGYTYEFRK